jgi:hypothetical protein
MNSLLNYLIAAAIRQTSAVGRCSEHVAVVVERELTHLRTMPHTIALQLENRDRVIVERDSARRVRLRVLHDRASRNRRDRPLDRQRPGVAVEVGPSESAHFSTTRSSRGEYPKQRRRLGVVRVGCRQESARVGERGRSDLRGTREPSSATSGCRPGRAIARATHSNWSTTTRSCPPRPGRRGQRAHAAPLVWCRRASG